jgi:hypothetical protein|tara:strand:- start:228 stop:779 length:552 start_codon:yes stop_codon:yes gene_type:complete
MKTDETEYDNNGIQGLEIKDENWIEDIKTVFNEIDFKYPFPDPDTELFYTIIWNKSLNAFDSPREVQVIVDAEDQLFVSVGTFGFVSFKDQEEQLSGMKLPLKCWIHTHPFGQAFFSGTDWKTINTWKRVLKSATVLGSDQFIAYECETGMAKKVQYGIYQQQTIEEPEWAKVARDVLDGEEE